MLNSRWLLWNRGWLVRLNRSAKPQASINQGVCPKLEILESRLAPASTLSIADSSVVEPTGSGSVNMNFTVTRSGDLSSQITVGYKTVAGTAHASTDFTPETGTTTFASGSSTATIAIPILKNGVYNNPNLNFSVQLTGVVGVSGAPVTLASQTTFTTSSAPTSVAVADLNGDGKADFAVTNSGRTASPDGPLAQR